jgi:hypothetical protein
LETKLLGLNGYLFVGSNTNNFAELSIKHKFEKMKLYYLASPGGGEIIIKYGTIHKKISTFDKNSNLKVTNIQIQTNTGDSIVIRAYNNKTYLYGMDFCYNKGAELNTYPILGGRLNLLTRVKRKNRINHLKQDNPHLVLLMFGIG